MTGFTSEYHRRLPWLHLLILLAAVHLAACKESPDLGDPVDGGTDSCMPGSERCSCTTEGECLTGLQCLSNLCVSCGTAGCDQVNTGQTATDVGGTGAGSDPNTSDGTEGNQGDTLTPSSGSDDDIEGTQDANTDETSSGQNENDTDVNTGVEDDTPTDNDTGSGEDDSDGDETTTGATDEPSDDSSDESSDTGNTDEVDDTEEQTDDEQTTEEDTGQNTGSEDTVDTAVATDTSDTAQESDTGVPPGTYDIVPTEDGWIAGNTNSLNIQGAVWGSCGENSTIDMTIDSDGVICAHGTAARVQDERHDMYWGAMVGFELCNTADDGRYPLSECPLNENLLDQFKGIRFDISGSWNTAEGDIRVVFSEKDSVRNAYVTFPDPGTNKIALMEKAYEWWEGEDASDYPARPANVDKIHFQIPANTEDPSPFDFCISNIRAVVD